MLTQEENKWGRLSWFSKTQYWLTGSERLLIYKRLKNKVNLNFRSFAYYFALLSPGNFSSTQSYVNELKIHPVPNLTLWRLDTKKKMPSDKRMDYYLKRKFLRINSLLELHAILKWKNRQVKFGENLPILSILYSWTKNGFQGILHFQKSKATIRLHRDVLNFQLSRF